MKFLTLAGALALACSLSSLSACASFGQPTNSATGQSESWASAAVEIAKDPKCGHTDEVDIMLGPVSSGHVKLARNCPVPAAPPASGGLAPGQLVAPASGAAPSSAPPAGH